MYPFKSGDVWPCYIFARRMQGNHNPNMIRERSPWEIFRDDFRGKLAEVAVRNYVQSTLPTATIDTPIDFTVTQRGMWDSLDIKINNRIVSVKSGKGHSRFLLIEKYRYNQDGSYSYLNHDGTTIVTDVYAFVRVKISPEISAKDMNYQNIREFWQSQEERQILYEVAGGITHQDFWAKKHDAPAGMICNIENFERVCKGLEPVMSQTRNGKDEETLQQDNYCIDSKTEMSKLKVLL